MTVTLKSPKHFRFTFVTRMQNLSLDVIENLYRANDTFVSGRDREAVKERLGYQHKARRSVLDTRYMDDMIIVHESKEYLHDCLAKMRDYVENERKLQFNQKTQIFPLKNGVEYLGFRFSLSSSGKVIRRLKTSSKIRYKRKLKAFMRLYREGHMELSEIRQRLSGFHGHMKHGYTFYLKKAVMDDFVLQRSVE